VGGTVGVTRTGKWAELDYKPGDYPMFPLGSFGHIVSRPIAEYIAGQNLVLHDYQVSTNSCDTFFLVCL
jgi:hypothetical protein